MKLPDVSVTSGEVRTRRGPITLRLARLGRLALPTGRLVATDPIVFGDRPPLDAALPRGRHAVEVCAASRAGDERPAWARLVLADGPVARWAPATLDGKPSAYPVDAGVGCFMDEEAALALEADLGDPHDALLAALDVERLGTVARVGGGARLNVAIFPSGEGDGVYATYLGLGADGAVLQVVTDFGLLPATVAAEATRRR